VSIAISVGLGEAGCQLVATFAARPPASAAVTAVHGARVDRGPRLRFCNDRVVEEGVSRWDLLAASLRADSADVRSFVEGLAAKLEASFPGKVRVQRHGKLFGGDKRVESITARLGEREYVLESDGGEISCSRRTLVRGVALKTEHPSLADWIDQLSQDLVEQAGQSESDRAALERMLG